MHRARSNKRLIACIAVEFGVEATDAFDLGGYSVVTQKSALLSKRNPELLDVSKRFAMQWIKCNPNCSLAVRRLYPWVHLSH